MRPWLRRISKSCTRPMPPAGPTGRPLAAAPARLLAGSALSTAPVRLALDPAPSALPPIGTRRRPDHAPSCQSPCVATPMSPPPLWGHALGHALRSRARPPSQPRLKPSRPAPPGHAPGHALSRTRPQVGRTPRPLGFFRALSPRLLRSPSPPGQPAAPPPARRLEVRSGPGTRRTGTPAAPGERPAHLPRRRGRGPGWGWGPEETVQGRGPLAGKGPSLSPARHSAEGRPEGWPAGVRARGARGGPGAQGGVPGAACRRNRP